MRSTRSVRAVITASGSGLSPARIAVAVPAAVSTPVPKSRLSRPLAYSSVYSPEDWPAIGQSLSNGLSEFVGNISFNIVGICYNLQLMKYIGENGVSAYGVLMYVGFIFGSVFIGYNMGISQVVAFKYGAGDRAELRSLLRKSCALIAVASLLITAVIELFAPQISSVFVGYFPALCDLTTKAL